MGEPDRSPGRTALSLHTTTGWRIVHRSRHPTPRRSSSRHLRRVHPRPLPLSLRGTSFTTGDAMARGLSRDRLRASDLARPTRSLRVPVALAHDTVEDRARTLRPLLAPDQWFSHTTAAALWQLPLPGRLRNEPVLHVTGVAGRQMRRPGVVGHRTTIPTPVGTASGLPATSPLRTWLECAQYLGVRELVVMGDQLVRRWCTVGELRRAAASARGLRGVTRARVAADRVRSGSESPKESELRDAIVEQGLPEPTCNVEVFDASGRLLGRVDLAYPELRIAIEYEGRHHQEDRRTYLHDIARRERFECEGWSFVLVADRDMLDERGIAERVRRRIRQRTSASP